jgi:hypothetical protein
LLHRSARNIDFWRLRALSSGVIILRVKRAKQNMTSRKIRMVGAGRANVMFEPKVRMVCGALKAAPLALNRGKSSWSILVNPPAYGSGSIGVEKRPPPRRSDLPRV